MQGIEVRGSILFVSTRKNRRTRRFFQLYSPSASDIGYASDIASQ